MVFVNMARVCVKSFFFVILLLNQLMEQSLMSVIFLKKITKSQFLLICSDKSDQRTTMEYKSQLL